MNWIEYSVRKPEPEPRRQVLVKDKCNYYSTAWSDYPIEWSNVTQWVEIDGPGVEWPDSIHDFIKRAGKSSPEEKELEEAKRRLKWTKPDPFEEWWDGQRPSGFAGEVTQGDARRIWDAAMKHAQK